MDNRKRTLSEGKTDQKNSRQKKAATRRVFGSSDSFSDTFSEEEHQKILNVFEEAAMDDPILVLKWNHDWEIQNGQGKSVLLHKSIMLMS